MPQRKTWWALVAKEGKRKNRTFCRLWKGVPMLFRGEAAAQAELEEQGVEDWYEPRRINIIPVKKGQK
jgi:hypothetical protein